MKIGAIVICRYNSSRLPGKILKKINNKALLTYIIERLKCVQNLDEITVATSEEATDQPIIDHCIEHNIKYYRGSLENVAERFLKCSIASNYDYAIRVNGDNLFLDPKVISAMLSIIDTNNYDLISNVKDRTFPKGISVEIINVEFYNKLYQKLSDPIYQEHVTNYMYENLDCGNFYHYTNQIFPAAAGAQLAIDTQTDFNTAAYIINSFEQDHTKYGFDEVFKRIKEYQRLE